ncbi:helix-turn-helix transcriptional regulator [Paenibacillus alkalitolerans]|uniref:helix-turn-helix transcriptional regulator n=1 Tax=Paenibacillus alkalitolerans TaxID=2799335 RepID=UPI0018F64E3E|nr:AraC family transcriptional regulator [Paenibacillus alkalitolerans]
MHPLPEILSYGKMGGPFCVEYVKRSGHYTMGSNHMHPYYEMYYLLSGERSYFIKDRTYDIRKGDLVLIDRYEIHKTTDLGVPDHERIVIYFDESFARRQFGQEADSLLAAFSSGRPVFRFSMQRQLEAQRLSLKLLSELKDRPFGFVLSLIHTAAELLLLAARSVHEMEESDDGQPSSLNEKMTEIVRHINTNYAEPLSLQSVAERFFISPYYLSRMFKEKTGFPFTLYLNLARVREAQRLLRETDMKIIDIASFVGFDNFSHFGKTFKKLTGTSPRTYRNKWLRI